MIYWARYINAVYNRFYSAYNRNLQKYVKSRFKKVGKNVYMGRGVIFRHPENISIGNNVYINNYSIIDGTGGVEIDDNVHISHNFICYSYNHNYLGDRLPYDEKIIKKPVKIGKNVWIGAHVLITPGVKIGEGAIIGMGTVVSRDVPPLSIVGSQPFRIMGYRDQELYKKLEKEKNMRVVMDFLLDRSRGYKYGH